MIRSRVTALLALLALLPAGPLTAQIGVDPAKSPYRDILYGNGWTPTVGYLGGDGSSTKMSPNSGMTYGIRFDFRFSGLLQGWAGLEYMDAERMMTHPDDSLVNRYSGPVKMSVILPTVGLQANLTGPKRWHGFAPFAAFTFGAAIGEHPAEDTTKFDFGTKLVMAPSVGTRLFLGEKVHLRAEALWYMWKMKYPTGWLDEPEDEPTAPPPIDPDEFEDWVATFSLRFGLGIAF
jgi:hypothetical protein